MGHLVPDVVLDALTVPAERASALWSIQISAHPSDPKNGLPNREVFMFNAGSTGARPLHDGLSAAAFPSGVSIIVIEATEHVGAVIVWRKDQRTESGGAGARRGGLGQTIGIEAREDYDFYINTISDRVDNSARGRNRGGIGSAGAVDLPKGTMLQSKDRRLIRNGQRLKLSLPAGGGYRAPKAGFITAERAKRDYGFEE